MQFNEKPQIWRRSVGVVQLESKNMATVSVLKRQSLGVVQWV